MGRVIGILACLFSLSVAVAAVPEIQEFDSKGLNGLLLKNTSGNTVITSTDQPQLRVEVMKKKFTDSCQLTIERSDHQLLIQVQKKRSSVFFQECEVDFRIQVPKKTNLVLTQGSGDLEIQGLHGELEFNLGSGNIVAEGSFAKLKGRTGSGDVTMKGLTGGGKIATGSGDINLKWIVSPSAGELDLQTGSGSATVAFPRGSKVRSQLRAGSGKLTNELGDSPNAAFQVLMQAGSGDLMVKSY